MLRTRIISAIVLIPVVLFLLFFSPETTALGTTVMAVIGAYEFYHMAQISPYKFRPLILPGYVLAIALNIFAYLLSLFWMSVCIAIFALVTLIGLVVRRRWFETEPGERTIWENWGITIFTPLYTAVPPALLTYIRVEEAQTALWWITMGLVATWGTDSGAMLVGMAIGKTPLAPRISPKKTVEGFIGGVIVGTIATCIIGTFALNLPLWLCVIMGVVLANAAVAGDLFESWFKRRFQVKDSGKIIPGHGGMLDRVDGLLAVSLLLFIFDKIAQIL
jgi:phosphatidate cytidylyltransferase